MFTAYGQDFFMYVNGQKRHYDVSATKIFVRSTVSDTIVIKRIIHASSTRKIIKSQNLNKGLMMIELTNDTKQSTLDLLKQCNSNDAILYTSPMLVDDKGKNIGGITNQVFVRLKNVNDYQLLLDNVKKYGISAIKKCDFDDRTFQLNLNRNQDKGAMQVANELYESSLFEYAEPNLIQFIDFSTNDQYYTQQWALNNTGQSGGTVGIDTKANQAWGFTTGSPDVRIAILDSGVDLTHPDLQANLLPGFDATGSNGSGGFLNGIAHGTACAGIAAAVGNNTIGIAGVAYDCRILPVSIASSGGSWTTTESGYIANGIDWARRNGASVISMSFGCTETNALNTEIQEAATIGRNNLGCILVAASGNANSSVAYPARNNNVISVGATTNTGGRASFSNYGSQLDVVAPGVNIYTTDLQGNAGYNFSNGTNGNYYASFDGTSAACPHVAGVAALILSVRPDLTRQQVCDVIEQTAQKVGGYPYATTTGRPNGTWYEQMGYGLLNAYAAVYAVNPRISGPTAICNQATYTIANFPTGATVQWSVNGGNLTISYGQGTSSAGFSKTGVGSSTIRATVTFNGTEIVLPEFLVYVSGPPARPYTSDGNSTSTVASPSYTTCYGSPTRVILLTPVDPPGTPRTDGVEFEKLYGSQYFDLTAMSKTMSVIPLGEGGGQFRYRTYNGCGISDWVYVHLTLKRCRPLDPGDPPIIDPPSLPTDFTITPNPASGRVTISLIESTNENSMFRMTTSLYSTYTIQLWNSFGLVKSVTTDQSEYQLDLTGVPSGFYYVHVIKDGQTYRRQLVVQ